MTILKAIKMLCCITIKRVLNIPEFRRISRIHYFFSEFCKKKSAKANFKFSNIEQHVFYREVLTMRDPLNQLCNILYKFYNIMLCFVVFNRPVVLGIFLQNHVFFYLYIYITKVCTVHTCR